MSDDDHSSAESPPPELPAPHPQDTIRGVVARLREAAQDLGAEVMIDLPSRLGDHQGLLLALANELEQLVK
jgi:hypothetical protein